MRLGGEVHDAVEVFVAQHSFHQCPVADVAMNEAEVRRPLHGLEVGAVAGIGQCIQHHDAFGQPTLQPVLQFVGRVNRGL